MSENGIAQIHSRPLGQAVEFRVAAQLDNLAIVRTLISAVGTFQDLDLDAVADLRLAIDEACTRLIRSSTPDSVLSVVAEPREGKLVVSASTTCADGDVLTPGSFSWHVISSLTDSLDTFHDGHDGVQLGGQLFGITMTARRVGPST
ncbi:anti-sigma factor [Mycobacterium sp. MYCO198283]|uniref:ATP-binding protein n=1 Tax=Mycobacterium sp. MYCO198283 TaxID=2883505 RepID=UPI001E369843|nr:anti-sigma factor [Mycobacterium sp. MYCO198283]MCG5431669.1 anti-sigma factor [Mycobacterium sp. MYCO198283]